VPLAAAALQFGLRDSRVHGTIVGASSIDRISSAVEHASVDIPEDLWAQLDTLVPPASVALDQPR
jgi:D-threo-aldose 1-dehydrogenase